MNLPPDSRDPCDPCAPQERRAAAPAPAGAALPDAASAASEAAAFVARIFAEGQAQTENAGAAAPAPASPEPPAAAPAPVPAGWPVPGAGPLQGQQVLVLGLGDSGLAMARWCVRCGAQVTVADTRAAPPRLAALQHDLPQVRFIAGAFGAHLVAGQGLAAVYRSPGLSPQAVAPVLIAAGASGIRAGGELDLYSMALRTLRAAHGYAPAVLAVTGTNGKTTVTSLTAQLVAHAGKTVAVAGNIGPTLLDTLAAHIDAAALPEVWVLELSSFQLDGATGFEPTAAVVLNLTQDHLDWHGDMAAYGAAKARIFGTQALMVLNREDPAVLAMRDSAPASAPAPVPVPARARPGRAPRPPAPRAHCTFGADLPQRPGDFGIETSAAVPWLVRALAAEAAQPRARAGAASAASPSQALPLQRLMPAEALRIRGRHNATNALAALALAQAAGCPLGAMLYGLREYRGEPHRVEPVGILGGIEYFDDSKGTNVGATVAALTGLGAERRLVVILGGDGKGQDFAPLAAPLARYARAVVLIGRDAAQIRRAIAGAGVALLQAQTLPEAVQQAAQCARAGDAVLLSPACASFDMFSGYEQRAQVFRAAVQALAHGAGQMLGGAP